MDAQSICKVDSFLLILPIFIIHERKFDKNGTKYSPFFFLWTVWIGFYGKDKLCRKKKQHYCKSIEKYRPWLDNGFVSPWSKSKQNKADERLCVSTKLYKIDRYQLIPQPPNLFSLPITIIGDVGDPSRLKITQKLQSTMQVLDNSTNPFGFKSKVQYYIIQKVLKLFDFLELRYSDTATKIWPI